MNDIKSAIHYILSIYSYFNHSDTHQCTSQKKSSPVRHISGIKTSNIQNGATFFIGSMSESHSKKKKKGNFIQWRSHVPHVSHVLGAQVLNPRPGQNRPLKKGS